MNLRGYATRSISSPSSGARFDADPVAAAETAGMYELAEALEQEVHELVALAERVARKKFIPSKMGARPRC